MKTIFPFVGFENCRELKKKSCMPISNERRCQRSIGHPSPSPTLLENRQQTRPEHCRCWPIKTRVYPTCTVLFGIHRCCPIRKFMNPIHERGARVCGFVFFLVFFLSFESHILFILFHTRFVFRDYGKSLRQ